MPTPQLSEHHQRGIERGLRPSKARPCPRVVAGKNCLTSRARSMARLDKCICLRFYPSILDHSQMWVGRNGYYVLTGEPYDLDTDILHDFTIEVEDLGLEVKVSGDNMWNPAARNVKLITITSTVPKVHPLVSYPTHKEN